MKKYMLLSALLVVAIFAVVFLAMNIVSGDKTKGLEPEWFSAPDFSSIRFLEKADAGVVTTEFDVVPLFNNIDGVIGYADSTATINNNTDLAISLWLNVDGNIQAMNGGWPYTALTLVPYTAGSTYHFKITADLSAKEYDAWVTPEGGEEKKIADDYAFRTTAAKMDELGKICLMSAEGEGQFKIMNHTPSAVEKLPDLAPPLLGYYTTTEDVELISVKGASIYYTTDNTTPSEQSTRYEKPLKMTEPAKIKAIAYKDNTFSDVATFEVKDTRPVSSPAAGTYGKAQIVFLKSADPRMEIYYTTNGEEPTEKSILYKAPINVTSTTTIKAIAVFKKTSSKLSTLAYTISTAPSKFLKADGIALRNNYGAGEIVPLRGTNAGGWLVQENWMNPTDAVDQLSAVHTLTERFGADRARELLNAFADSWWQEADFDNIKSMGMNVIRLPFTYLDLLDGDLNLKPDAFDRLDWFVEQSSKRGLYVILDLHGAPGSQNGLQHSGDSSGSRLYNNELFMAKTVYIWEEIANRYKENPYVAGYDLLNEPVGAVNEDQWDFFDRLYDAIRAVDPNHNLFMNATWDPENMPDPSVYGWENVSYEYHFYEWDQPGNYEHQTKFIQSKLDKINEAHYDVPVLIGEFNLFDLPRTWEFALNLFNEQGWSWTSWSYKSVDSGNWAIYNSTRTSTPKAIIGVDSDDEILEKWSHVDTTAKFQINPMLYDVLTKYAKQ